MGVIWMAFYEIKPGPSKKKWEEVDGGCWTSQKTIIDSNLGLSQVTLAWIKVNALVIANERRIS